MASKATWTEKDKDNAMLYGVCVVCGAPREMETVSTYIGEQLHVTRSMVCPRGHDQYHDAR